MASVALGVIGAGIGSAFGAPQLGWSVGTIVGGMLFPPRQAKQERGRLDDLRVTGSGYGVMIPQILGAFRCAGVIIWAQDLVEHSTTPGGGKSTSRPSSRVYTYTASFQVLVCEGPVTAVLKIRGEDRMIYDIAAGLVPDNVRIYLGTEQQLPDTLIESIEGAGNVPAYRGVCTVVFEDFDVSPWGNRIPNLDFDVVRASYRDAVTAEAGLQAYYRFSLDIGQLQDSGPNNYDLTDTGSSSTTPGAVDTGIISPVASELHSITGTVAALEPAELTVEGWFKYKGGAVTDGSGWWQYLNPATNEYAWQLLANPNIFTVTINVQFRVNTLASGVVTVHNYAMSRDSNWHHAAVVCDTTGSSRLYVDGVLVDTVAAPVTPLTITANVNNRIRIKGADIYWDELACYNTLLSADNIGHHFRRVSATRVRVADILAHQFTAAGLDSSQYDVAAATDEVRGFMVAQRQAPLQTLDPVLRCYSTDLIEAEGKLIALRRGGETVTTIPGDDLGAQLYSEGGPPAVKINAKLMNPLELPRRLDLNYFSVNKNYEQGSEPAIRPTKDYVQESVSIGTPLAMEEDEARQIAEKLLYQQWHERKQFSFSLPPSYLDLAPGDVLDIPVSASTLRVRVIGLDYAPLGPVAVTAVLYEEGVLTQTVTGAAVVDSGDETAGVVDTLAVYWSGNALRNQDAFTVGFYVAVNGATAGDWPGCILYWSRDGGTTYNVLKTITDPGEFGVADTVLAPGVETADWDDVNDVEVTMTHGSPETTSDAAILNGDNAFLVGDEVIQAGTVTAVDADTFTLSHLLRGKRGTDAFWSTHAISEPVISLIPGRVTRVDLTTDMVGQDILLKAVTFGQDIGDVSPVTLTITGAEFTPYAPIDITGTRDMSNNLTIDWVRRDRAAEGLRAGLDEVMSESPEAYEIDILSGVTVVRTISASTPSAAYSAAEQTTDGLTPGNPVDLIVYMIGVYGRGYPGEATV